MRKLILMVVVFFTITTVFSQQGINYKAIISDNGAVLQNQAVQVQFSVLEDGTTLRYQETHSTTTETNGIILLNIGEGTVVSGVFNDIDWSDSQFLKVEIDTGNGYVDFGTTAFKRVPYAIYAENGGANWLNELGDVRSNDFTSVYVGLNSGVSENDSFLDNTALGTFTLRYNEAGRSNSAFGSSALANNQGSKNTAIGGYTLKENTSGFNNTAVGTMSLFSNKEGYKNTANGYQSLYLNTTGNLNTANGNIALYSNTTGDGNTAIGNYSLHSNTEGDSNVALGSSAGKSNIIGNRNVFLGNSAGYFETGDDKLYIENSNSATPLIGGDFSTNEVTINGFIAIIDGTEGAGKVLTSDANGKATWQTGSSVGGLNDLSDAKYDGSSLFVGNSSGLNDDATGNYNTGVGHFSLYSNTSGSANTSVGNDALYNNTTGSSNTAFGYRGLYDNTTGSDNTAYGFQALYHNETGGQNTASGRNALYRNTTGSTNTAYGWSALSSNTLGYSNTASGHYALGYNTTGHSNTANGSYALLKNKTGYNNTAQGYSAGFENLGNGNIFLGYEAGYNETGDDKLYIENSNSATPLIGGDFSTDEVTINGTLDVSGNVTANLTGDVTGNLTGNVEGEITAPHSGNSDMKAYIYGSLYATTGAIKSGPSSDGFTSTRISTGRYRITFNTSLGSEEAYLLIISASNTASPRITTFYQSGGYFDVHVWDMSGNHVDAVFNFVVYKR